MRKPLILFAILLPSLCPAASLNWLVNGDFKSSGGWAGNPVLQEGHGGLPALFLENKQKTWTEFSQKVELPDPLPPALEISGWVRTGEVVRGEKDWECARVSLVFYDKSGKRVGDWPATTASLTGTHDWDYYSNQYSIPSGTAWVTVELSLGNCTGRAWFSDLRCLVYDFDGKPLAPGAPAHPDRKASQVKTDNWISDPDLEAPGSTDWGQAHITGPGRASLHCLAVRNDAPSWNLASQDIALERVQPSYLAYGGWVRTEKVVRGREAWEAARLGIDFRDAQGKQLAGWQDSVCKVTGDTEWTYYEKRYNVPSGTAQVHLDAGLGNCTGRAWFDDLSLVLYDATDKRIAASRVTEQATDTSGWYPYAPPAKASDAPLDLSYLNEKPAGTHGFVVVRDGHFAFADGARVRFWGTDIVGPNLFLEKGEADAVAARMAKLGVNLVRLHFLDNDWGEKNLFDPGSDDTQSLNPRTLDQVEYLIGALKREGIYVYPDWAVGRKFRAGDKVPAYGELEAGAKTVIHFSRRIIELNKKYAGELLSHVNPYTGMALKDDPVYVGNEIVNESSIFCGFGEQKFPEPFWEELQGMFTGWAAAHSVKLGAGGKITRFRFDWEGQKLVPTLNPENEEASLKFLLKTQEDSDLEMKAFLRKLSPHALLAGSNMGLPVLGNIKSDSLMDFMDTHAYWDHPQIWNVAGGWANVDRAPMNNRPQLLAPFQGSLLFSLSHAAVVGKPLIVTEWNDCVPNEYRSEGVVLMAAYGSLQDWDGLLQFDYGPSLMGSVKLNNFAVNSRPDNEPLFQAGALIFRQGLLQPSKTVLLEHIFNSDLTANGMKHNWLFDDPWLPYAVKVAKHFTGTKNDGGGASGPEGLYDPAAKTVKSSTGEEFLDYGKGVLKIDAPLVQGFTGAIGAGEVLGASNLSLTVAKRNPWASVLMVSLDGKPLFHSGKILLVAVARAENSGQVYNATRTALKDPGHTPILMQGVEAGIGLKYFADYTVTPLDESGKRGKPLETRFNRTSLSFTLSPSDKTAYYLMERK